MSTHPICIVCNKEIANAEDLALMSDLFTDELAGFCHKRCRKSNLNEEELSH